MIRLREVIQLSLYDFLRKELRSGNELHFFVVGLIDIP